MASAEELRQTLQRGGRVRGPLPSPDPPAERRGPVRDGGSRPAAPASSGWSSNHSRCASTPTRAAHRARRWPARLLGFTNREGEGQYGIEQRFQDLLGGRPRVLTAQRDVSGRVIADTERLVDPGVPGSDIRLTIDAGLQLQLEKELYAAWVADTAKMASAVVMDPMTGEILAWATVPGYDANDYGRTANEDPSILIDPIVSQVYEPGSVMKMFIAAAAYDSGAIDPTTIIKDTRDPAVRGREGQQLRPPGMGPITFEDVIAYSRNIVAARSARDARQERSGASRRGLYGMWDRLGIGRKTGVETSGEVPGLVVDPATRQWAGIDLANRSFGQGVAVTQLQLAQSFATMVNGGLSVRPRLVADLAGEPRRGRRRPSRSSTHASRRDLRDLHEARRDRGALVRKGTLIPGYAVGGKTGTAQIWDSSRGQVDAQRLQLHASWATSADARQAGGRRSPCASGRPSRASPARACCSSRSPRTSSSGASPSTSSRRSASRRAEHPEP